MDSRHLPPTLNARHASITLGNQTPSSISSEVGWNSCSAAISRPRWRIREPVARPDSRSCHHDSGMRRSILPNDVTESIA